MIIDRKFFQFGRGQSDDKISFVYTFPHWHHHLGGIVNCSFVDGAMLFVRWKPTAKDRVQGPLPPHHQLSPKLSSISSGPLLCCFHQWLSESDHNDMLSSTCAGTSKTFFKALSQFFNSIGRAWPSRIYCHVAQRARLCIILPRQCGLYLKYC